MALRDKYKLPFIIIVCTNTTTSQSMYLMHFYNPLYYYILYLVHDFLTFCNFSIRDFCINTYIQYTCMIYSYNFVLIFGILIVYHDQLVIQLKCIFTALYVRTHVYMEIILCVLVCISMWRSKHDKHWCQPQNYLGSHVHT